MTLHYGVLPLWFLVLALFVPRVSLILAWFSGALEPFSLTGLVPPLLALLLPRVLVLILIYVGEGVSLWFVLHLVVMLMVWGGSGSHQARRWTGRRRPGREGSW
jgi:hypothetical protein